MKRICDNLLPGFKWYFVFVPLIAAVLYIFPIPYVYLKYNKEYKEKKQFTTFAFNQNYLDEIIGYYPAAGELMEGRILIPDIATYEAKDSVAFNWPPLPLAVIAAVKAVVMNHEWVLPALDVIFCILLFLLTYRLAHDISGSARASILAGVLFVLPMPILNPQAFLNISSYKNYYHWFPFSVEPPLMSRTSSPQISMALFLLCLIYLVRTLWKNKGNGRINILITGALFGLTAYSFFYDFVISYVILAAVFIYFICIGRGEQALRVVCIAIIESVVAALFIEEFFRTSGMPGYVEMLKRSGLHDVSRLPLKNALFLIVYCCFAAAVFIGGIKKYLRWFAVVLMPLTLVVSMIHGYQQYSRYLSEMIILSFAASLPINGPLIFCFIILLSALVSPILMQFVSGSVISIFHFRLIYYYIFTMFALPIVAGYCINELKSAKPRYRRIINMASRSATFAIIVICLGSGFINAARFAERNRENYFVEPEFLNALKWLDENTEPESVVLAFDIYANSMIISTTRDNNYLPTQFNTLATDQELFDRFARAMYFLDVVPDKIELSHGRAMNMTDANNYFGLAKFPIERVTALERSGIKRMEALSAYRADYLWFGPREKLLAGINPDYYRNLTKVFQQGGITIYKIN